MSNKNETTSKATARPWSVSKHTDPRMDGSDGSHWARVLNPSGQPVIGHMISADVAVLIVERVNGWDALVAERDENGAEAGRMRERYLAAVAERDALRAERNRLREALRVLVNLSGHPYFPAVSGDLPAWAGAIQEAREAVKGGAS